MYDIQTSAKLEGRTLYLKAQLLPATALGQFSIDTETAGTTFIVVVKLTQAKPSSIAGQAMGNRPLDTTVQVPEWATQVVVTTSTVTDVNS